MGSHLSSQVKDWAHINEVLIKPLELVVPSVLVKCIIEYWIPSSWYKANDVNDLSDPSRLPLYQQGALQGYAVGQIRLGHCYSRGVGVKQNHKEAFRLYQLAQAQDDSEGEAWVAYYLYKGFPGVEKDERQSVYLSKLGVAKEHPFAYYTLSLYYRIRLKDPIERSRLCQKGADLGNSYAQNSLGYRYRRGDGLIQDYKKAVHYYTLASKQGNPIAQYNLANCYRDGVGVKKNLKETVRLYHLAAAQGEVGAQNGLGYCYEHGYGVKKDMKKIYKLV